MSGSTSVSGPTSASVPASRAPVLPAAIGRYRPLALLGAGAMGSVYRAHDPLIDRIVAIKVVRTEGLDPGMHDEFLDRFRREVQAAGRCSHPAIVGVFDFAGETGNPFIVMEFVAGRTLNAVFRDPTLRAALPVRSVLGQVLDGLAYAHRLGITHRDIKPANILITEAGHAKIADFGIARLSGTSMTQAGTMLGTPSYMAPEQVSDDAVDHRADLFATGAILYEALVGRPPFAGRSLTDTILRVSGPAPADFAALRDTPNAAFVPVLAQALAKRREERFQSADDFAAALRGVAGEAAQVRSADATIVASPPGAAHALSDARAIASPGTVPPGNVFLDTAGTLARQWDPDLLQRAERALSRHLGPMAKLAVRKAAARSAGPDELAETLAGDIADGSVRATFLRDFGVRAEASLVTKPPPTLGTASGASLVTAIPQPAIDAAQAALVVFVGPMARVLVRKAAAQATSRADFIERLLASVSRPDEVSALRRRLQAEVEPALR